MRLVEYAQGEGGFVLSHEVFIYLFDALLMFLAVVTFLVLHPSRLIRDAKGLGTRSTLPVEHVALRERRRSVTP